ncbi:MAG: heme lyase CcmF/NrfE family subunit [Candidatus Hydrogenedentota bacterium]|nr:MAG: heme lyase CcmF/NrfE family subunit [Candidatus Hydrogenedentota bacterium]
MNPLSINSAGKTALWCAFLFTLLSFLTAVAAAWRRETPMGLLTVSRRAFLAGFTLTTISTGTLLVLLGTHSFQNAYVWAHTSTTLPPFYSLSALWAGQEGSLLLWVWILLGYGALLLVRYRESPRMLPWILIALASTALFFLWLTLHAAPVFETLWEKFPEAPVGMVPEEGAGLNPLLQNPGMVVHPPLLYLGYVGFVIPFAFAIAVLGTGRTDAFWLRSTRRWSMTAWLFLTLGILAGARWAYVELGWGGYWGWDPVENASFIPWLTATAYIHSVMIEERRGMFRIWNMFLIIFTYILCLFGTFLTRSGLVSSVHSFANSPIGTYFAVFLGVGGFLVFGWLYMCRDRLRSVHRIESFLSREAAFLFNNVIILSMAFAVLWGTIYPMISEFLTGERASVGPPYFNKVLFPLAMLLLLLTAVGPIIAWRRAEPEALKRNLARPLLWTVAFCLGLLVSGVRNIAVLAGFFASGFVLFANLDDYFSATAVRHRNRGEHYLKSAWNLLRKNGRRYGGYLVHVGIALLIGGVMGAYYNREREVDLLPGDTAILEPYSVKLERVEEINEANRSGYRAVLAVSENGRIVETATPEISFFRGTGIERQRTSEVDILPRLSGDLYLVLAGVDEQGRAGLQLRWNALVGWVWVGGGLMFLGSLFALAPPPSRKGVRRSPA